LTRTRGRRTLQAPVEIETQNYAQLSPTLDQFKEFVDAVGLMQRTHPNVSPQELARIHVPVVIAS
jgi:hypothetical protein